MLGFDEIYTSLRFWKYWKNDGKVFSPHQFNINKPKVLIEKQLQKTKSKGVHETRASTYNLIQKVLFSIKNV